jgi:mono/diheme cytochrome c family protein
MKSWAILMVVALAGLSARAVLQPPPAHAVRAPAAAPAGTAEARGAEVYASYGCGLCHGAQGAGGFANPNAETDDKVPAVLYVAEGYTRAELAHLIRAGTPRIGRHDPAGPLPPFRMPGWGDRMTDRDVDDLVAYLMSLYPEDAGSSWR